MPMAVRLIYDVSCEATHKAGSRTARLRAPGIHHIGDEYGVTARHLSGRDRRPFRPIPQRARLMHMSNTHPAASNSDYRNLIPPGLLRRSQTRHAADRGLWTPHRHDTPHRPMPPPGSSSEHRNSILGRRNGSPVTPFPQGFLHPSPRRPRQERPGAHPIPAPHPSPRPCKP